MQKKSCVIVAGTWEGKQCLFKNRDRTYNPALQLVHELREGVEVLYMEDLDTGYLEGINEFGVGMLNSSLLVGRDEKEKKLVEVTGQKAKARPVFLKSLSQKTLDDSLEVVKNHRGGVFGHTLCADSKEVHLYESTSEHLGTDTTLHWKDDSVRTNHGITYADAGYTEGPDHLSSVRRRTRAGELLEKVKKPGQIAKLFRDDSNKDNKNCVVRDTKKYWTSSQILLNLKDKHLTLYHVKGRCDFKGVKNKLPKDYKAKLSFTVEEVSQLKKKKKKKSRVQSLNSDAIRQLKREFNMLMKNIPKLDTYSKVREWATYLNNWNLNHLRPHFYDNFKESLATYGKGEKWVDYWTRNVTSVSWELSGAAFSVPIRDLDDYWTEGKALGRFQQEKKQWESRTRRAARKLWKLLKDLESELGSQELSVQIPSTRLQEVEGFRAKLIGVDLLDKEDSFSKFRWKYWEIIQKGLRAYRKRASQVLPWLIQKQLPLEIHFKVILDRLGTYVDGRYIELWVSGADSVKGVAHVMAHEMAHHLYKTGLSDDATRFWDMFIKGGKSHLYLRQVLSLWRKGKSYFDFIAQLKRANPVMYLQYQGLMFDPKHKNEDWMDRSTIVNRIVNREQTVEVNRFPITAYANKNPEEAFCEAVGYLVAYGPQTLQEEVRGALKIMIPNVKLAQKKAVWDSIKKWWSGSEDPIEAAAAKIKEYIEILRKEGIQHGIPNNWIREYRIALELLEDRNWNKLKGLAHKWTHLLTRILMGESFVKIPMRVKRRLADYASALEFEIQKIRDIAQAQKVASRWVTAATISTKVSPEDLYQTYQQFWGGNGFTVHPKNLNREVRDGLINYKLFEHYNKVLAWIERSAPRQIKSILKDRNFLRRFTDPSEEMELAKYVSSRGSWDRFRVLIEDYLPEPERFAEDFGVPQLVLRPLLGWIEQVSNHLTLGQRDIQDAVMRLIKRYGKQYHAEITKMVS